MCGRVYQYFLARNVWSSDGIASRLITYGVRDTGFVGRLTYSPITQRRSARIRSELELRLRRSCLGERANIFAPPNAVALA